MSRRARTRPGGPTPNEIMSLLTRVVRKKNFMSNNRSICSGLVGRLRFEQELHVCKYDKIVSMSNRHQDSRPALLSLFLIINA